jgi:hypothetical protein
MSVAHWERASSLAAEVRGAFATPERAQEVAPKAQMTRTRLITKNIDYRYCFGDSDSARESSAVLSTLATCEPSCRGPRDFFAIGSRVARPCDEAVAAHEQRAEAETITS